MIRPLQFGHGGDAVDDFASSAVAAERRSGFNSATAVTPWMTPAMQVAQQQSVLLQFGHGGDAVDDATSTAFKSRWR